MKKRIFLIFALIAAALISALTFASCDNVHIHVYRYAYDAEKHIVECAVCGEKKSGEAHSFSVGEVVEATCDHVGYSVGKCVVCGYSKTDFTSKKAHEFQTVAGSDARECVNCHRKESALVELADAERYGYKYLASLADGAKYLRVYEKISAALAARSDKAPIFEELTKEELETVFHCAFNDHPEYFWAESGYKYVLGGDEVHEIEFSYLVAENDLAGAKEKFNEAIDKILSGVSASMTDFEKELYIHDAVVRSNVYDTTYNAPMTHTAYGAAVLKTSVCDGYTKLFQTLMTRCGIPAATLSGYAGENHSWNAVKIDGEWYMIDLTWDDPVGHGADDVSHAYFNRTGEQFAVDHFFAGPGGKTIENYYVIPTCTADRYNYFKYFDYECGLNIDAIESVIRRQAEAGEKKDFQMQVTGLTGTAKQKTDAITHYMKNEPDLYGAVSRATGLPASSIRISYGVSSDGRVLSITVE